MWNIFGRLIQIFSAFWLVHCVMDGSLLWAVGCLCVIAFIQWDLSANPM